jgi:hypothetical protein
MNKYYWVIIIAFALFFGYQLGVYITIKAVARIGRSFVDEELIRQAIYQFQNNIGECFPLKL